MRQAGRGRMLCKMFEPESLRRSSTWLELSPNAGLTFNAWATASASREWGFMLSVMIPRVVTGTQLRLEGKPQSDRLLKASRYGGESPLATAHGSVTCSKPGPLVSQGDARERSFGILPYISSADR